MENSNTITYVVVLLSGCVMLHYKKEKYSYNFFFLSVVKIVITGYFLQVESGGCRSGPGGPGFVLVEEDTFKCGSHFTSR